MVVVLVIVGITSSITVGKIHQLMLVTASSGRRQSVQNDLEAAFALAVRNRRPMRISWNSTTQQMTVTDRAGTTVFRRTNLSAGVVRPPIIGRELLRVADRGVSERFRERHAHHHDQPLQYHQAHSHVSRRHGAHPMTLSRIRHPKRIRRGFSLIEVMVAMTIFSLVMVSFGKAMAGLALRGRTNDLAAKRNASLQLEANKFGAVPFASLAAWSTANQTITRGNVHLHAPHQDHTDVRVALHDQDRRDPVVDATKKDSVMFDRTKPPSSRALHEVLI